MKLKNAPERKRERQLGALERLQVSLETRSYKHHPINVTKQNKKRIEKEIEILEERTVSDRRGIRTKKTRSV